MAFVTHHNSEIAGRGRTTPHGDVRAAKRAVVVARRQTWRHTAGLIAGAVTVLVTLLAIGYDLSH